MTNLTISPNKKTNYSHTCPFLSPFKTIIFALYFLAMEIKITLPDGNSRSYNAGITAHDVARDISEGLARNVISAKVNGVVVEKNRPIVSDATLQLLTWNDPEGKATFWHSSAHILAEAIQFFYPNVKFGYGPPIENGFYYDLDFGGEPFGDKDFQRIEKKFKELASSGETFVRKEVSKADALAYWQEKEDPYKLETIQDDLEDGEITFYESGNFTDLCRGPHVENSKIIKAMKIMRTSGAFWKGDQDRKQLTRVYGISFPKQKMLTQYLEMLEEAKKRDHRKLGRELELFTFSEKVGMGLPLWLPKGAMLRERLEQFLKKKQVEDGYLPVMTPHIGKKDLYVTSGHYEKYGKDSFQPILTPHEGEEYLLKPMNCPHHCEIYRASPRSYRDLPLRLAEFGTVYRYEQHGELHGLTRVRGFTQDDAHLFCRPDQVKKEFIKVIDLVLYIFSTLNFEDFEAQISLRDPEKMDKYFGSAEQWDKAEAAIIEAAAEKGLNTVTELGEAAFYGPKLDFMVRDALGRKWQLGTIQVDYQLPDRFELEYVGADNLKHRPVMIHRAPFGSMERFVAVLLEHTGGNLPLWLSSEQLAILPVSEKYHDYADKVLNILKNSDIRASFDGRSERMGRKIRDAEVRKTPYMLILGDKEAESETVSVRKHGTGDLGSMTVDELKELIKTEELKSLKLID